MASSLWLDWTDRILVPTGTSQSSVADQQLQQILILDSLEVASPKQ